MTWPLWIGYGLGLVLLLGLGLVVWMGSAVRLEQAHVELEESREDLEAAKARRAEAEEMLRAARADADAAEAHRALAQQQLADVLHRAS